MINATIIYTSISRYAYLRKLLSRFVQFVLHLLTSTICFIQRIVTFTSDVVTFSTPPGPTSASAVVAAFSNVALIGASIYLNHCVSNPL